MSVPRDHHFIPAFFLKEWAGPNGKLIEYTIRHGKLVPKAVGPRSTGYETDLYAFPELPPEERQFIEQHFWDYADRVAARAHEMHLSMAPVVWNAELRSAWSRFIIGMHLRHPDMMPELRAALKSLWEAPNPNTQAEYEKLRTPTDPATLEEYIALNFPLMPVRARLNLILTVFDNEPVGQTINEMNWCVLDLTDARHSLLLSDRPVEFSLINTPKGYISMPISPTKLFVAANDATLIQKLRERHANEVVTQVNTFVTVRARRFIWAQDRSQDRFVKNRMSMKMEPMPLLPNFGLGAAAAVGGANPTRAVPAVRP